MSEINFLMDCWVSYMKKGRSRSLDYPSQSLYFQGGGVSGEDEFEIMADDNEYKIGMQMDVIINGDGSYNSGIARTQKVAVSHFWLKTPFHYPTQDMDYVLALEVIEKIAKKRGLMI